VCYQGLWLSRPLTATECYVLLVSVDYVMFSHNGHIIQHMALLVRHGRRAEASSETFQHTRQGCQPV